MGHIYTRTGDGGTTELPGVGRVAKDDPRIELLGALDEANSLIGLARADVIGTDVDGVLEFVQQRLLNCGATVSGSTAAPVSAEDVAALEAAIDRFEAKTGGFSGFVLPGCDRTSAPLHVARSVVRRAERAATHAGSVDPTVLAFLNRASDLLYVAAQYSGSGGECHWDPKAPRP